MCLLRMPADEQSMDYQRHVTTMNDRARDDGDGRSDDDGTVGVMPPFHRHRRERSAISRNRHQRVSATRGMYHKYVTRPENYARRPRRRITSLSRRAQTVCNVFD